MNRPRWLQFRGATLLVGTAASAALLLAVVLTPQVLSRRTPMEVLRHHVDEVARMAASQVDGDVHRRLIDGTQADETTRRQALAPLLRLHEAWPEAFYVYTMGVRDGTAYFILDTAQDPEFARRRGLQASEYMEPFEAREEYAGDWLDELMAGHTYVNPDFEYDDYGYFLTGHAPIRDSAGRVAGFVGVDFDLDYYLRNDARFRRIQIASAVVTSLLSVLLGYLYARYRYAQDTELRLHYEFAMQDPLTGLLNRRGATAGIDAVWSRAGSHTHAALLLDVDNFKSINDSSGHGTGDAILQTLASALRASLRPGDITARLGGDEFLIFARDCDQNAAEQIATRLLTAVRGATQAPVRFSVSIGISVMTEAEGGFDILYRQADSALYCAKGEGRDRYAVYREG